VILQVETALAAAEREKRNQRNLSNDTHLDGYDRIDSENGSPSVYISQSPSPLLEPYSEGTTSAKKRAVSLASLSDDDDIILKDDRLQRSDLEQQQHDDDSSSSPAAAEEEEKGTLAGMQNHNRHGSNNDSPNSFNDQSRHHPNATNQNGSHRPPLQSAVPAGSSKGGAAIAEMNTRKQRSNVVTTPSGKPPILLSPSPQALYYASPKMRAYIKKQQAAEQGVNAILSPSAARAEQRQRILDTAARVSAAKQQQQQQPGGKRGVVGATATGSSNSSSTTRTPSSQQQQQQQQQQQTTPAAYRTGRIVGKSAAGSSDINNNSNNDSRGGGGGGGGAGRNNATPPPAAAAAVGGRRLSGDEGHNSKTPQSLKGSNRDTRNWKPSNMSPTPLIAEVSDYGTEHIDVGKLYHELEVKEEIHMLNIEVSQLELLLEDAADMDQSLQEAETQLGDLQNKVLVRFIVLRAFLCW
jgi:hypothetical protein